MTYYPFLSSEGMARKGEDSAFLEYSGPALSPNRGLNAMKYSLSPSWQGVSHTRGFGSLLHSVNSLEALLPKDH